MRAEHFCLQRIFACGVFFPATRFFLQRIFACSAFFRAVRFCLQRIFVCGARRFPTSSVPEKAGKETAGSLCAAGAVRKGQTAPQDRPLRREREAGGGKSLRLRERKAAALAARRYTVKGK